MNIGENISKAIKESKWLEISYINQNKENTFYWIAINDIEIEQKKLYVTIFNDRKSMDTFDAWIFFDNIKSAKVIEFTSYEVSAELIKKIEKKAKISENYQGNPQFFLY